MASSLARDAIVITTIESPVGPLTAAAMQDGICLLEFADPDRLGRQQDVLRALFARPLEAGRHPYLDQLSDELTAYFRSTLRRFTVPLVTPGTPFEQRVWTGLRAIPYGATTSYEGLAQSIGAPASAARAVGRANGMNRIAIVIPCHRVITKQGTIGGYGGGVWRKQHLLEIEGRAPTLFSPTV